MAAQRSPRSKYTKYGSPIDADEDDTPVNPTTEVLNFRERQLRLMVQEDRKFNSAAQEPASMKGSLLESAYQQSLNDTSSFRFENVESRLYQNQAFAARRSPQYKQARSQVVAQQSINYREIIYASMIRYFGDLQMTKIKDQGPQKVSIFAAKVSSGLTRDQRYVMVFAHSREPRQLLSEIRWISLHTRCFDLQSTLGLGVKLENNDYPRVLDKVTSANIVMVEDPRADPTKTPNEAQYFCRDFPIAFKLLAAKETWKDFPKSGNIAAGLETFNAALSFKD